MTEKSKGLGSDLSKIDTYENTVADYVEIPELTDEDFARGTVNVGGVAVSRPRGRPPVNGGKEQVALRIDRDVLAVFRAEGPGWQSRINDILRKAAGLAVAR